MVICKFLNDNNVEINVPDHSYQSGFLPRGNHEEMFRKISTLFINQKIVKKNIIDLGCWIGDNAIPWAKNTSATIYAIDPSPENCAFVELLKKANNVNNVTVIQKAISDSTKIISTNDDLHHSTFSSNDNGVNKLLARSLDDLLKESIIKDVDYIHLDVEGMESLVIKGSTKLINDCRPYIAFEQHLYTDDYKGLSEYLKNLNYSVYLINEILPGCRPDCRNFLALPNEKSPLEIVNLILNNIKSDLLLEYKG